MHRFTAEEVARATESKLETVQAVLPLIYDEMAKSPSFLNTQAVVACLATAAVECHFDSRDEIGNNDPWHGRGIIQLTGESNYKKYAGETNIDLFKHPELAKEPKSAAVVLVRFLTDHGCDTWASRGDWRKVRRLVNGGDNGLSSFLNYVWNLLEIVYAPVGSGK